MADNYRGAASNYPAGFTNVTIRGLPITQAHPGQVFWLGNATSSVLPGHIGASDSNPGTFAAPFSTLDYAVGQCTASRGDIIFVKPGHTETYSAASALALDVAGVAVVGLGTGTSRPTFTCDTVNTTPMAVSAANVSVTNCVFIANFLTIAGAFTLTTAKAFTLENCEFQDTSAALNFANVIKSTGAANTVDGLYAANNLYGSIGTTFNTFLLTANDIDKLVLLNNRVMSIATTDVASLVVVTSGALTNGYCAGNTTKRKNTTATTALITGGSTTSSTIMVQNFASTLDTTTNVSWTVTTGIVGWGNSLTGAIAGQGFPIPALDS